MIAFRLRTGFQSSRCGYQEAKWRRVSRVEPEWEWGHSPRVYRAPAGLSAERGGGRRVQCTTRETQCGSAGPTYQVQADRALEVDVGVVDLSRSVSVRRNG
jgi:hypothetical protein